MKRFRNLVGFVLMNMIIYSCTDTPNNKEADKPEQKNIAKDKTKPPSSFPDSLRIDTRAAIFYYPDSLQLEKIKALTDKNIFDGIMHEYFYQFRNAHNVLKDHWPEIEIFEARNVRYLLFTKADKSTEIIDLNTKNDAYGLFVFDKMQSPVLLELTNVESGISFYFQNK